MEKLLPLLILLGITFVGFISNLIELNIIRERYEFTIEYRKNFINFINELFLNKKHTKNLIIR